MSDQDNSVVRFEDVSLHFEDTPALDHVSFSLSAGETRVILGAAGAGKTVLLKTAVGLVKPDSGRVFLLGQDITDFDERQLYDLRAKAGILFQEGGLFDSMTIEENVAYPLLNQPTLRHLIESNGGSRKARRLDERVREILRFVELEHTLGKVPSELSGGMRRRVGIARAVVTEPALVLYDSPTAGLDPITANTIVALILKERDMRNAAALMVTHRYQDGHLMANFRYNPSSGDIERVTHSDSSRASTQFLVMKEGRLIFEGSEKELRASTDSYVRKLMPGGLN